MSERSQRTTRARTMVVFMDLFVASRIGSLKHVRYDPSLKKKPKDSSRHLQDIKSLQKGEGIRSLTWCDVDQTRILISRKNRRLQIFDVRADEFVWERPVDFGSGEPHSVCVSKDLSLCGTESGIVKFWRGNDIESGREIDAGAGLETARMPVDCDGSFATGGKENDLKIWNCETGKVSFAAKNLPHDRLQLRVPIWVSGVCFTESADDRVVAICSRYGAVRLYDARAQRRPVVSLESERQPFNCISPGHRDRHVLVGSGRGLLNLVDLRMKGKFDKSYKGSAGSITDVFCCRDRNAVVSTSLDRYLRIHDAESKELLAQEYLTSKLTCFLLRTSSESIFERAIDRSIVKEEMEEIKEEVSTEDADEEYENMFNNMEVVGDGVEAIRKKKSKSKVKNEEVSITKLKKKKRKTEMDEGNLESETDRDDIETPVKKMKNESKVDGAVPSLEDNIKKLLKSSEKIKKKYEKQKKQKKAKSVFNL